MTTSWETLACHAVGALRAHGAATGDRVVLLADNSPAFLAFTWVPCAPGSSPFR